MKKFKVKISNGINYAPYIIVISEDDIEAEKQARKKSRLSDFENWNFIPVLL